MADKIFFKIGDVANKFNVNPSLLRYWEKEFDFIRPRKNDKGTRYYSKKDIENIEIIYHLVKVKGMTIHGVKEYLVKRKNNNSIDKLEVVVTLKKTRELLVSIKEVLEKKNTI
jgi:DNA-binding transcriptional MerR regulator